MLVKQKKQKLQAQPDFLQKVDEEFEKGIVVLSDFDEQHRQYQGLFYSMQSSHGQKTIIAKNKTFWMEKLSIFIVSI